VRLPRLRRLLSLLSVGEYGWRRQRSRIRWPPINQRPLPHRGLPWFPLYHLNAPEGWTFRALNGRCLHGFFLHLTLATLKSLNRLAQANPSKVLTSAPTDFGGIADLRWFVRQRKGCAVSGHSSPNTSVSLSSDSGRHQHSRGTAQAFEASILVMHHNRRGLAQTGQMKPETLAPQGLRSRDQFAAWREWHLPRSRLPI